MPPDSVAGVLFSRPVSGFRVGQLSQFGILALGASILWLVFAHNVNWDEFYFLSLVHDFAAGRLERPLQTFHVHLFQWLLALPGHEMTQIIAGRLFMLACLLVTALSIFSMSRSLAGRDAALVAVLGFVSSGFVVGHGASFRADPLAAALLMVALTLVMTSRMRPIHMLAVALLVALACLVTIKSALYLPAFLGALLWRIDERALCLRTLAAGVAAIAFAGVGYLLHASGLAVADGKDGVSHAVNAVNTTLLSEGFMPRRGVVTMWLALTVAPLVIALAGLLCTQGARRRVALVLMLAPVLSILVYRNAFPYFFPFIVPPLMVVVALGVVHLRAAVRAAMVLLMLVGGGLQVALSAQEPNSAQREVIAELHRMFPEPVPYFQRSGMISSFPRQGPFMSSWGMKTYRRAGVPIYAQILRRDAPPLLIASNPVFLAALTDEKDLTGCCPLLPEDADALRGAYVHYSGPVWLLGQETRLSDGAAAIDILRAGDYRLQSDHPVRIDGRVIAPGQTLNLKAGRHIVSGESDTPLLMIWATKGTDAPAPSLPTGLFFGFWSF